MKDKRGGEKGAANRLVIVVSFFSFFSFFVSPSLLVFLFFRHLSVYYTREEQRKIEKTKRAQRIGSRV